MSLVCAHSVITAQFHAAPLPGPHDQHVGGRVWTARIRCSYDACISTQLTLPAARCTPALP